LTSLVVCINELFYDIRERNVTIRSEIRTTGIRSLGFREIRGVVLCSVLMCLISARDSWCVGYVYSSIEKMNVMFINIDFENGMNDLNIVF
jgi:hypothetical protein